MAGSASNNNPNLMLSLSPGTPVTGQWCDECQKPSAVNVPVNILFDNGVQPVGHATFCTEHDDLSD